MCPSVLTAPERYVRKQGFPGGKLNYGVADEARKNTVSREYQVVRKTADVQKQSSYRANGAAHLPRYSLSDQWLYKSCFKTGFVG